MEALLLAEHQSVHIELTADQLGHDFGLQQFELIQIVCGQLNVYSRVNEGFPVPVRLRYDGCHILQIAFGHNSLLQIVGIGFVQTVFVGGIADDFLFLHRRDMAGIDAQGHAVLFSQVAEDGLFLGGGGIFPKRPNAAVGVSADEVVGVEFDHRSYPETLGYAPQTVPALCFFFCFYSLCSDITMEFLGKVQMEVIAALLQSRYHLKVKIENVTTIYKERPLKKANFTAHIEIPPNPFWASIGLSIEPLPIGAGLYYKSNVSYGYLNRSFQNAVEEGIRYGCEQGLYGWEVTDLKVIFEYGLYYSPVSTPADFRHLAPIVFEQALKQSGTELLEPCLSFELYVPQDCNARVYNDLKKFHADIESIKTKHHEIVVAGKIPARTSQLY